MQSRTVALKVVAHFAHYAAEARARGQQDAAPAPDAETVEAIIDAAFWSSLRHEESYIPKISLVFLSPEQAVYPLTGAPPT